MYRCGHVYTYSARHQPFFQVFYPRVVNYNSFWIGCWIDNVLPHSGQQFANWRVGCVAGYKRMDLLRIFSALCFSKQRVEIVFYRHSKQQFAPDREIDEYGKPNLQKFDGVTVACYRSLLCEWFEFGFEAGRMKYIYEI